MDQIVLPKQIIVAKNFIAGQWEGSTENSRPVLSPYSGTVIGEVLEASANEVDRAVRIAKVAGEKWAELPIKERTLVMYRVREVLLYSLSPISQLISAESGKLVSEARAGLLKGIEILEYAISLQNLVQGEKQEVSRGVFCETRREPLGVVAGVTPFNFPAMVPMWMMPIAITLGNSFLWKPSEKTPLTSTLIADAFSEAGLPNGVLTVLQGGKSVVESLCDHPIVSALGFVGSTAVAKSVYSRCAVAGKRVLALGGAKNHLILMPDADPRIAVDGIVSSFTGCSGQRCMAASVLVGVGDVEKIISQVVERAKGMELATDMGAIVSKESLDKLKEAIGRAEQEGAKILLDGRSAAIPEKFSEGFWIGPTIIDNVPPDSFFAHQELFGPILTIVRASNLSEAISIENSNQYGNAASVFTSSGAVAEEVARKARVGMVGVNVGVPVPREPFSFGGHYESKFGVGDMTGSGGVELWTNLKKITTKWSRKNTKNWME